MDKVEFAFRKFDIDGDGYLSWEEFQQVFVFNTEKNKTFKAVKKVTKLVFLSFSNKFLKIDNCIYCKILHDFLLQNNLYF